MTLVFAAAPFSSPSAGVEVTLTLLALPPPSIHSVVSAASVQPAISPGEIVTIFGAHIGTPPLSAQYDGACLYPTTLGNTTVTFNGTAAPLLYVSTDQINLVVPYEVAGRTNADVVVTHALRVSAPFSIPIIDNSPTPMR